MGETMLDLKKLIKKKSAFQRFYKEGNALNTGQVLRSIFTLYTRGSTTPPADILGH